MSQIRSTAPHIMLVDDAPEIVALFSILLKHHGYEVHTALDGFEALRMWHQFQIDEVPISCLILDWSMPGLTGIELATHIRRQTDAAIVFITAYHDLCEHQRVRELNAEVWKKPIDITSLVRNLRRVLAQTPVAARPALLGSRLV